MQLRNSIVVAGLALAILAPAAGAYIPPDPISESSGANLPHTRPLTNKVEAGVFRRATSPQAVLRNTGSEPDACNIWTTNCLEDHASR